MITFDEAFDGVLVFAETLVDIAEFRGEIRAFTQQSVAADTVIAFPQAFACGNLFGNVLVVVTRRPSLMRVECQGKKEQQEKRRAAVVNISRHAFGENFLHGVSPSVKKSVRGGG